MTIIIISFLNTVSNRSYNFFSLDLFQWTVYQLTKNNLVRTYPFYYNQFDVSFDIRPTGTLTSMGSIIHLTRGQGLSRYGDRVPGIWFFSRSRRLHICSAINNNKNYCYTDRTNLPSTRFSKVRIFQKRTSKGQFIFAIVINSRIKRILVNKAPATFYNVRYYLGNPWSTPAKAIVRNVKIKLSQSGNITLFHSFKVLLFKHKKIISNKLTLYNRNSF